MGGGSFLEKARHLYPATARLVLSGHADQRVIIDAAGPTQQFLTKPCEPDLLVAALTASVATLGLMADPRLRSLIGGQENLPKPPAVYRELCALADQPETSVVDVARLVEGDVATTTEVFKLINSSFFGVPSEVTTVERAVSLLGVDVIKALVLAGSMFSPADHLPVGLSAPAVAARGLRASLTVGRIGRAEAWDDALVHRFALAALLHDVGLLVLAAGDHAAWAAYRDGDQHLSMRDRQEAAFGCSVGRASAYLLGLWGFHPDVVAALVDQPLDLRDERSRAGASPGTLAVAFARHEENGTPADGMSGPAACDSGYLTEDRVAAWGALHA